MHLFSVVTAGRLLLSREQLATRALTEALARVESFLDGAVLDESVTTGYDGTYMH